MPLCTTCPNWCDTPYISISGWYMSAKKQTHALHSLSMNKKSLKLYAYTFRSAYCGRLIYNIVINLVFKCQEILFSNNNDNDNKYHLHQAHEPMKRQKNFYDFFFRCVNNLIPVDSNRKRSQLCRIGCNATFYKLSWILSR